MIAHLLRSSLAACVMGIVFPCCVQADSLRVVADTETTVPGGVGTFSTFALLNGVDPSISGQNVAFGAGHPTGIYALIDGSLRRIATIQEKVPGTDVHFGFGLSGGSSPSISGSNVAFGAFVGPAGPAIICAYVDGSLRIIATAGVTPAPGSAGHFQTFFLGNGISPSISGENVAFAALNSDGSNGIYAYINGELRVIADSNTVVPGHPDRTFLNFGQLEGTSPSISGENVAFAAKWSSGGPSPGRGVFASINGELRLIADNTTTGGNFGLTGGGPSISGENVAFLGSGGVYASINGELRVIADSDTPAPGTTGTFGAFPVSPVISGENVAFGAGAGGFEDPPTGRSAIFAYIDGALQLIASETGPAPGREDATFNRFLLPDQDDFVGEGVRPAISGENVVFSAQVIGTDHHVRGVYALLPDPDPDPPPIPALSSWSLIVLTLLLLTTGTLIFHPRMPGVPAGFARSASMTS